MATTMNTDGMSTFLLIILLSVTAHAVKGAPMDDNAELPSAPTDLVAAIVSTRLVTLSWQMPLLVGSSEIFTYSVFWREEGSDREHVLYSTSMRADILFLKPATKYEFRVIAFNREGPSREAAEITVETQAAVHVPSSLVATPLSSTSILVKWAPPSQNGPITHYRLYYYPHGGQEESEVEVHGTEHTLTGLQKFTDYSFRVAALNSNGPDMSTEEVNARTYSDVPSEPPQNVTLEIANSTSIIVHWEPPPDESKNGIITGYKVRYKLKSKGRRGDTVTTDGNRRVYALTDLNRDQEYSVCIQAMTVNGSSPATEWLSTETFMNDLDAPEPVTSMIPPVGLKAIVISPTTIVATWLDITLGHNQRITDNRYYTIRYHMRAGRKNRYINSPGLNAHIDDLTPNTEYEFSVKVIKGRCQSTWCPSVLNKTFETAPTTAPIDLTPVAVEGKPTWISLNWQPPRQPNGQITGYLVFYTTDTTQRDRDWVVEPVLGDRLSTVIWDLTPETTYYFKVQARNSKGYGPMSPTVSFNLKVPPAPENVQVCRINPTAIEVKWDKPAGYEFIAGYQVYYNMFVLPNMEEWQSVKIGPYTTTDINGLEPFLVYAVRVRAKSGDGQYGNFSDIKLASSLSEAKSTMVQNFHARTQNPRSVMLEWAEPRKSGVTRYKITYEGEKRYEDQFGQVQVMVVDPQDQIVPKDERTLYIDGLIPKMIYTFNISAKYMDGTWSEPNQLQVETSIDEISDGVTVAACVSVTLGILIIIVILMGRWYSNHRKIKKASSSYSVASNEESGIYAEIGSVQSSSDCIDIELHLGGRPAADVCHVTTNSANGFAMAGGGDVNKSTTKIYQSPDGQALSSITKEPVANLGAPENEECSSKDAITNNVDEDQNQSSVPPTGKPKKKGAAPQKGLADPCEANGIEFHPKETVKAIGSDTGDIDAVSNRPETGQLLDYGTRDVGSGTELMQQYGGVSSGSQPPEREQYNNPRTRDVESETELLKPFKCAITGFQPPETRQPKELGTRDVEDETEMKKPCRGASISSNSPETGQAIRKCNGVSRNGVTQDAQLEPQPLNKEGIYHPGLTPLRRLNACRQDLIDNLFIDETFLAHMITKKLLNQREAEKIRHKSDFFEKAEDIFNAVECLIKREEDEEHAQGLIPYETFRNILLDTEQEYLLASYLLLKTD